MIYRLCCFSKISGNSQSRLDEMHCGRVFSRRCIEVDHDEGVELSSVNREEGIAVAYKGCDRDGIGCVGGVVGSSFDSIVDVALEGESGLVGNDEVAIVDEWGEGRENAL